MAPWTCLAWSPPWPRRPADYLFTVALAGDTHVGETASGVVAANWPQAFRQDPGLPPYPEVMLTGMLGDLRRQPSARGADRRR